MGPHPYWARSSRHSGGAGAFAPRGLSALMSLSSPPRVAWAEHGSHVVGLGGAHALHLRLLPPSPARDLGHVVTVLGDVLLVLHEPVAQRLLRIGGAGAELGHS